MTHRAVGLVLALSCVARAQTPDASSVMHDYFAGEMRESFAFEGMGAASLGAGVGLWVSGGAGRQGAAVPLLAVGLLQVVLGLGLQVRTPGQVSALDALLGKDPHAYGDQERHRMKRVVAGFGVYKVVEVALSFAAVGLAGAGGVLKQDAVLGAGLTLGIEALAMLVLDFFAEARARSYDASLARGP